MAENKENTRGGSSEQHAEAGRQSHKNQDNNSSNNGERGGTSEQHAEAGRKGGEASHEGGNHGGRGFGGFAGMDPNQQREIASEGGKASHESGHGHEWDSEEAREAGRKGGQH